MSGKDTLAESGTRVAEMFVDMKIVAEEIPLSTQSIMAEPGKRKPEAYWEVKSVTG